MPKPMSGIPWYVALLLTLTAAVHCLHAQPLKGLRVLGNGTPDVYHMFHIDLGRRLLSDLAVETGFRMSYFTDFKWVNPDTLKNYDVVVWAVGRADSIPRGNRVHLESFVKSGKSIIIIHTGTISSSDWTWWHSVLGGAPMAGHPNQQRAKLLIDDPQHAITRGFVPGWILEDENYKIKVNPRLKSSNKILISLDETSYNPGSYAMGDHPAAWVHESEVGRAFVTIIGHVRTTWSGDPNFKSMVRGAIQWAAEPLLVSSVPGYSRARGAAGVSFPSARTLVLAGMEGPLTLALSDMRGRRVRLVPGVESGDKVDLTGLGRGAYLLTIQGPAYARSMRIALY